MPIGVLITFALVGAALYYGIAPGRGYVRYYAMKDAMRAEARMAPGRSDPDIRRRLRERAAELRLPSEAQRITIRRRGRPREITITASWPDTIVLPFYTIPITYRPTVRAPL